jgi:Xaa-Pro dipeptidase
MPFHFAYAEYATRLAKAKASLVDRGLDALLMFAPESHY